MLQDDDEDDDDEDGILATLTAGDDDSSEEESDSEDEAVLAQAAKVHKPLPASLLRCPCTCLILPWSLSVSCSRKRSIQHACDPPRHHRSQRGELRDQRGEFAQLGTAATVVLPHQDALIDCCGCARLCQASGQRHPR